MSLFEKYNRPTPRYTSYPTVPYWDKITFSKTRWRESVLKVIEKDESISLYVHLPFCENLCTFCGCNKYITRNHKLEVKYVESILLEWQHYRSFFKKKIQISDIHLGGGTPTFFSPQNLEQLIRGLITDVFIDEQKREFSFEGHPNNTTIEHLRLLFHLGFRRVSFGVQDYDEKVQKSINRIQSLEQVKKVTDASKQIGYKSVNHDILYGLPFQSIRSVAKMIKNTIALLPDRIAFYSYAHVPWIGGTGQRGFAEKDLPPADLKRQFYEIGRELLERAGYREVGMDHFALPGDPLFRALQKKALHRNFMGYTTEKTNLLVGLGVSAISDSREALIQNEKNLNDYYRRVFDGQIPFFKGHWLNDKDKIIRKHILNLFCQFQTTITKRDRSLLSISRIKDDLKEMSFDQLIKWQDDTLTILPSGRAFVRNVAMAFDERVMRNKPQNPLFSMSI